MHLGKDFNNMGPLLKRLEASRLHSRDTFKDLPQQGVYVFYDGEKPVYVGRSSRQTIKKRLQQPPPPVQGKTRPYSPFGCYRRVLGRKRGTGRP